jgi:hypothetical protein
VHDLTVDLESGRASPLDLPGRRRRQVSRVSGQHREFVSAEPRDRVGLARRGDQALADLLEQAGALRKPRRISSPRSAKRVVWLVGVEWSSSGQFEYRHEREDA